MTASDVSSICCSIRAHVKERSLKNVLDPVVVNATLPGKDWGRGALEVGKFDVVVCINMMHITEFAATEVSTSALIATPPSFRYGSLPYPLLPWSVLSRLSFRLIV